MNSIVLGAIDIGSNAVRLLVSNVFEEGNRVTYKKQSLVRVPIRLGADAFLERRFGDEKIEEFMHAMHAFKHLIEVYKPASVRALATSAFREAANAPDLVDRVYTETGLKIEIISGREEAEMVYANGLRENMDANRSYLYMDIGGGSTELTLFSHHEAVAARSFNIGSIRMLLGQVSPENWNEMKEWVTAVGRLAGNDLAVIGSGGNVNKYCKLLLKDYGEQIHQTEVYNLYKRLKGMTTDERMQMLYLSPDRADVIVPAGKIFSSVMKWCGASHAYVPKIGVSDGLIKVLYAQLKKQPASLF